MPLTLCAQGRVMGRILSSDGNPVAGATVMVLGQTTAVTVTNAQGYYVMLDVPAGSYELKATKRGQPAWKGALSVSSSTTQRMDIKLGIDQAEVREVKLAIADKPKKDRAIAERTGTSAKKTPTAIPVAAPTQKTTDSAQSDADLEKAVTESESLVELDEVSNLPEKDVDIVGGIAAVQKKVVYPESARRAKIGGQVVARVYVGSDGNVMQIKVIQSSNPILSEEVVRVLTEETKFVAAQVGDKKVNGAITIPVKFQMER
jgi:TonB family protein